MRTNFTNRKTCCSEKGSFFSNRCFTGKTTHCWKSQCIATFMVMPRNQARSQLRTAGGEKSFLRGPKFFKLCPMVLNNVQHIFPGGVKNSAGVLCLLRSWLRACQESRRTGVLPLCPLKRGGNRVEVPVHNSVIGNFMVYQIELK